MEKISHLLKCFLLSGIKGYQWLFRPWVGHCCRFYPSCSQYAQQAINKYGAIRGCVLTLARLLKCHPFHPGGIDEIP